MIHTDVYTNKGIDYHIKLNTTNFLIYWRLSKLKFIENIKDGVFFAFHSNFNIKEIIINSFPVAIPIDFTTFYNTYTVYNDLCSDNIIISVGGMVDIANYNKLLNFMLYNHGKKFPILYRLTGNGRYLRKDL
jgi:hypothetical protein